MSLAVVGILCLAFDPGAHKKDGTSSSIFVCLIDLGSAIFGALYFLLNAKNVKELPICMLILMMNLHIWLLQGVIGKFIFDWRVQIFSNDPVWGCLGFINSETWLFAFIPFGIPAAFLGSASYVLLLMFYSPVVVSNAFLLEPFFA